MAVRIRLKRVGSKRRPFYRFIVVDSRGKRDGGFLDQVGYYNPISKPHEIKVDEAKLRDWLSKGAQMSDSARSLLKKTGVLGGVEAAAAPAEPSAAALAEPGAGRAAVAEAGATPPEPAVTGADAEVTEGGAEAPEPAATEPGDAETPKEEVGEEPEAT